MGDNSQSRRRQLFRDSGEGSSGPVPPAPVQMKSRGRTDSLVGLRENPIDHTKPKAISRETSRAISGAPSYVAVMYPWKTEAARLFKFREARQKETDVVPPPQPGWVKAIKLPIVMMDYLLRRPRDFLVGRSNYRFLDVYTFRQGNQRMASFIAMMVFFGLLSGYLYTEEAFRMYSSDMDQRDMVISHRAVSPSAEYLHLQQFPGNFSMLVTNCTFNTDTPTFVKEWSEVWGTGEERLAKDPHRFVLQLRRRNLLYTHYLRYAGEGNVTLTMSDVIKVTGPSDDQYLPMDAFKTVTDYDKGTRTMSVVTGVNITISYFEGRYNIFEVIPAYGESETGDTEDATLTAYKASKAGTRTLVVGLRDRHQPPDPLFPWFLGNNKYGWSFFLSLVSLGMSIYYTWALVMIYKHTRENNGLPPPFWTSKRRFRGW